MLVGALTAFELERADARDGGRAGAALRRARGRGGPAARRWPRSPTATATDSRPLGVRRPLGRPSGSGAPSAWRRRRRARRVLIGDATRDELDPEALDVRALELFLGRAGAPRRSTLPVAGLSRPGRRARGTSARRHRDRRRRTRPTTRSPAGPTPSASAAGPLPVALFRRGERRANARHGRASSCPTRRRRRPPKCPQLLEERPSRLHAPLESEPRSSRPACARARARMSPRPRSGRCPARPADAAVELLRPLRRRRRRRPAPRARASAHSAASA